MRKTNTTLDPKMILLAALRVHDVQEQELTFMIDHLATANISWYTMTYGAHIGSLLSHWGDVDRMLKTTDDCPICLQLV